MEGNKIIEIEDCAIGFRGREGSIKLLEKVNLQIRRPELVALLGRNGSGKTTFLRSTMRLQELVSGRIRIKARSLEQFPARILARNVGFVSSVTSGIPEMSVEELVRIGRYPYTNLFGILSEEDIRKVNEAIGICRLEELRNIKLARLSDGERQRAMLASVFSQDTDIILLDEPTSFLDIQNKFDIFGLLNGLVRKGKTIILSTHDLHLATLFADKIWLINERNITEGAPEDLFLGDKLAEQFSSDKVKLDRESGEFGPVLLPGKEVSLRADKDCEIAMIWTRKALRRKGYTVGPGKNFIDSKFPLISILKEKNKFVWKLQQDEQILSLTSIYHLITQLENLINHELN